MNNLNSEGSMGWESVTGAKSYLQIVLCNSGKNVLILIHYSGTFCIRNLKLLLTEIQKFQCSETLNLYFLSVNNTLISM